MGCYALLQRSSRPRDQTSLSCTGGRFFTIWTTGGKSKGLCLKFVLRIWWNLSEITGDTQVMVQQKASPLNQNGADLVQQIDCSRDRDSSTYLSRETICQVSWAQVPNHGNGMDFSSVQLSGSVVSDYANPWTAACQASLSFTNFWTLLKLMSIELVMPSNHLILCHPFSSYLQSFPASGSFSVSQFFASGGQSIGTSASASVLQMNIQDWFPLGLTGLMSLQSKGLSRVFSNTTVQKHQFFPWSAG